MITDKRLGMFCDKCKKVVIVEEGERILKLINLECSATFFRDDTAKLTTETQLCPKCSKEFNSWLNPKEAG